MWTPASCNPCICWSKNNLTRILSHPIPCYCHHNLYPVHWSTSHPAQNIMQKASQYPLIRIDSLECVGIGHLDLHLQHDNSMKLFTKALAEKIAATGACLWLDVMVFGSVPILTWSYRNHQKPRPLPVSLVRCHVADESVKKFFIWLERRKEYHFLFPYPHFASILFLLYISCSSCLCIFTLHMWQSLSWRCFLHSLFERPVSLFFMLAPLLHYLTHQAQHKC